MMKVLLITHNPTTSDNNMGKTLLALFSEFKKEELCQLYIHSSKPDTDACNSYFNITDKAALKSIFGRSSAGTRVVFNASESKNAVIKQNPANKSGFKRLMRDAVWKCSRWYSKRLTEWIDAEKPTCIFLAPGYACFIYDIALKISRQYGIPIVTYICDDYYFVNKPKSFFGRLHLSLLRRKTDELMYATSHLIAISQPIKENYSDKFGVASTVIMTGASDVGFVSERELRLPLSASYFGNIGCNRYVSLADIGRALDEINLERNTDYTLNIYTNESNKEILSAFEGINSVSLKGFLTGDAFKKEFSMSDMLVHVEAFDSESIDAVKNSVSTKIADALASGKPLFAYGPKSIASMRHLFDNECAIISNEKSDLNNKLLAVFTDIELCRKTVHNAMETVEEYHDLRRNSDTVREIIEKTKN